MIRCGLVGLAVVAALATSSLALGQTKAPPTRIAVVDVQKVQRESRAMIAVREELQALRKKYGSALEVKEKEIQAEFDRLRKDKELSRGEYDRRIRALQAEVVKLRRQSQARSEALNQAFEKVFARFRQEVVLVVRAMAVEESFTLVLNRATLIHASPQYEVTDAVVARLNKRLPKLALDYKDPVGSAAREVEKRRAKAAKDKK